MDLAYFAGAAGALIAGIALRRKAVVAHEDAVVEFAKVRLTHSSWRCALAACCFLIRYRLHCLSTYHLMVTYPRCWRAGSAQGGAAPSH